jgi:hypothetical protein
MVDMENGAGIIYSLQPAGDLWDNLHPFTTGYAKMAAKWMNALSTVIVNIDFGQVGAGASADRTFNLSNLGTANLSVSSLSTTHPAFAVVSPAAPFNVAPGNSVPVTVRFSPTALTSYAGDLQINSNDPDEAQLNLSLAGTGIQPPPNEPDISVSPASLNFGQVVVGSTGDRTLTVSNLGTQTLNVSSLTPSDPAFSVVSPTTPFSVAPGNNALVTLRFTPAAVMIYNGNLQIASNDPDESNISVPLSGQGISTPAVAFRINAGGLAFTDSTGDLFVADKAYVPGDFGYTGGKPFTSTNPINNTTDDPLFQAQRSGIGLNPFSYTFDNMPAGNYSVTVYFAELRSAGPNQRFMDVTIEGNLLLDNYDIFAAAGGNNTAVSATFLVPVSDGQLNINFSSSLKGAMVAAIEVVGG